MAKVTIEPAPVTDSAGSGAVADRRNPLRGEPMQLAKAGKQFSFSGSKVGPEEQLILKQSVMRMAGFQGTLQKRNVVLNATNLYYTAEGSDQRIGTIHISDLLSVSKSRPRRMSSSGLQSLPSTLQSSPSGLHHISSVISSPGRLDSLDSAKLYGIEIELQGMWVDAGHTILLLSETEEEQEAWIKAIEDQMIFSRQGTWLQGFRSVVRRIYNHAAWQLAVIGCIFINFVLNIVEAEVVPAAGSRTRQAFDLVDILFTVVFTIELLCNILANWPSPFLDENIRWNVADTVIVAISLVSLGFKDGIPGVKIIRIFRCFRVVRVFKRLTSLRLIVGALGASIEPIANTCVVLLLATSVYSIMGQGLYGVDFPEEFGTFSRSFFTMMQCTTMDGWASELARPMFRTRESGFDGGIAVFFLSYVLFICLVIVNVMVAVLLDEFLRVRDQEKSSRVVLHREEHCLDPLLNKLAVYYDDKDLSSRLKELFNALDSESTGEVTMEHFIMGIKQLDLNPQIQLSKEEFHHIFGQFGGSFTYSQFESVMRHEMNAYVQRSARRFMASDYDGSTFTASTADLLLLKHVVTMLEDLSRNSKPAATTHQSNLPGYSAPVLSQPSKQSEQEKTLQLVERMDQIDARLNKLSLDHDSSVHRLEQKLDLLIDKLVVRQTRALDDYEQHLGNETTSEAGATSPMAISQNSRKNNGV